ncbi:hypothetical protein D3C76_1094630 [compost metagenome]
MNESGANGVGHPPQTMRKEAVNVISGNFIFICEAVQHTNSINDNVRVHSLHQTIHHIAVIYIQQQTVRVRHIPRGVEDTVQTLTAEIVDHNMAGHSVSTKYQELHDRNPPRFRMSRISSFVIS